ncbi:alpha/beta hydrolase [Paractinoplanes brasiliensis]|uniref:Acetyl esterase/lipase n=1 Tax=Paractinoplanes brasiliensis TaxID=52695 RepID=A0A4R6JB04_9ACTN|nr:alpha/beta hydrolase [Actinoplanes brasiliensis]TDO32859.1 acetyl esterase/lipase [Actinoplanes brasiliensis]GID31596.1 esterase [Actinoplanes brasiliensis]
MLDAELGTLLAGMPPMPPLTSETLNLIRPYAAPPFPSRDDVTRREVTIPGAHVPLTVLSPAGELPSGAPGILWLHGGGMVMGNRYSQIDIPLEWLAEFGAVVVSVDYRLAPEARGVTPVLDCYAALEWLAANAAELGVDPERVVVAGASAGGGLAAGVALLARDHGGPAIAAQVLIGPMLDHRNRADSTSPGTWSREANEFAWGCLLGGPHSDIPPYVSPALAGDLSGLPPAYVDAGSAELFRDEDVAYANRIWAAGGQAELHVWGGGFHGFDALFPGAALSAAARVTRTGWLSRLLS